MTKFGALVDIGRNVNEKKSETLVGMDSKLQLQIDQAMIDLDKAKKEDELGVNVILAAKIGNEGTMEQPEQLEVSSILNTTNGLATIGSVINSRKGKMSKGDGGNANFHIVSSSSDQMKHSTSLSAGSMRPMVRVKQERQHLIESQLDLTNSSSSLVSQAMELKKVKTMMNCRRACQPMELWPSLPLLPPG
ncbi:putative phosphopyruvate hydratase [Rosa chinensis]|uniref:Putative phosphopyruvate hydratase n=1 Tax=Rosa chinensis TaxID=74649 RepID=A0A2P6QF39_ROSCH|nr:putative phosphopyruvate hydratase [Rosa chinensis]